MKNIIYINGVQVIDIQTFRLQNRNRFKLILEDGTDIVLCKGTKVMCDIKCSECDRIIHIIFNKRSHLKTLYICKHCRHKGNRNGFYGKHHSEEFKSKQSVYMKEKYSNGNAPNVGKSLYDFLTQEQIEHWKQKLSEANSGTKNPFYGKSHSDETKQHWSQIRKGKNMGEDNPMYGKRLADCMSEEDYQKWLEHFSETLKRHTTRPEKIVSEWLDNHGIKYKHGFFLFNKESCHSHQYDFFIYDTKYLIEVQGDYWHGNPNLYSEIGDDSHKKLDETQIKKRNTDNVKKVLAESMGYRILYIWESDINNENFDSLNELLLV